jgi:peptidyl-prolyl cis-trans isomerase C
MTKTTRKLASLASVAALAVGTSLGNAQAPASPPAAPTAPAAPAAAVPTAGKPVAVVNGEPIAGAEVASVVEMVVKQRFRTQPPTDVQRRDIWAEVVAMFIDDAVFRQFLSKSGIQVTQADVEKHFTEMKTAITQQGKTMEQFYKESGQNEAQIKTSIINMVRWAEYIKTKIAEAEVKKYYAENKDFFDKVTVRVSHILLRVPPTAPEADKQAARQKLAALRADIVAGKIDFAEAAKKYSQCSSASAGGEIGFIPRKMLVDETFAKTAFALKAGEISDVVQTEAGLHLIKVLERKPGEASDFEKIKDDVREIFIDELRQNIIAQERKTAKVTY